MSKYLLTSALPYANGYIHLGHCAGAYLPADIFARFMRISGENVLYVCGSDEHGVAITIAAEKERVTPQHIIDKYHNANKDAFEKFGMSFDIYSRTSIPEHHKIAREFFADFLAKNYLSEKEEEQFYDAEAKMFLPDRYVEGICPNCGFDKARGDQCDSCGAYYNQVELKSPISLISKKTPEVKKTTHWYFRFNLFQEFLEQYIGSHDRDWKDNVLQQTRSWLKQGLTERAITRDLTWGVQIDGLGLSDEKINGKALYVWFDAVLGYISATKQYFTEQGNPNEWQDWWQNEDTNYYAFIGKDNIVFHTLIFPAMLFARRDEKNKYILPENVPANEFLNLEGQKFSKSRNWSIDLRDFINDFPQDNMIDGMRYALATNLPENKDADFTWKDFQAKNNNELAAIYGNYINRTLQFLGKNFDFTIPNFSNYDKFVSDWKNLLNDIESGKEASIQNYPNLNENDFLLISEIYRSINDANEQFRKFRLKDAITSIMNAARAANKYFNDEEPWKTIKTNPEQTAKTMFVCTNIVYNLSILFAPILPLTSKQIQLLFTDNTKCIVTGNPEEQNTSNLWRNCMLLSLKPEMKIAKPEILFGRIEDEFVTGQIAKLGDKTSQNVVINTTKNNTAKYTNKVEKSTKTNEDNIDDILDNSLDENLIDIDLFKKVKLRTAIILVAENVPKSKKLMKLQVDLGNETRQILAGIAETYSAEELIGKTVVVVANLKPAKLMGYESNGMLLAANLDGKLSLVSPAEAIGLGAEVR